MIATKIWEMSLILDKIKIDPSGVGKALKHLVMLQLICPMLNEAARSIRGSLTF